MGEMDSDLREDGQSRDGLLKFRAGDKVLLEPTPDFVQVVLHRLSDGEEQGTRTKE